MCVPVDDFYLHIVHMHEQKACGSRGLISVANRNATLVGHNIMKQVFTDIAAYAHAWYITSWDWWQLASPESGTFQAHEDVGE